MKLIQERIKELQDELNKVNYLGEKINNPYVIKNIVELQHIIDNESLYLFVLMQKSHSEEDGGRLTTQENIILGSFLTYDEAFKKGSKIEIKEYHAQFGSAWEYVVIVPIRIGQLSSLNEEFIINIKEEDL